MEGLNYHLLPALSAPGFRGAYRRPQERHHGMRHPRPSYDAESWRVPVLSKQMAEAIETNPPRLYARREALADQDIRRRYDVVTETEKGTGRPLQDWSDFEAARYRERPLPTIPSDEDRISSAASPALVDARDGDGLDVS